MKPLPKTNETGHKTDRLSHLPDDILHHILKLSRLTIFDVVKLGVLSKRWNSLWLTMPYLDIDIEDFYYSRLRGVPVDHALVEKLRSFVNWVLIRQANSRLLRFSLMCSDTFNEVQILRWLRAVAERNVQTLDIAFVPSAGFSLPLVIALNDSLRSLTLNLYDNIMKVPSVVRLNQIKSLDLHRIQFSDSHSLQRLFSGCCSLESLTLNNCELLRFSYLDFSSTRLKEFIVDSFIGAADSIHSVDFEIKLSCPNLVDFDYSAPASMHFILENVISLETACFELYESDFRDEPQVCQMIYRNLKEVHNVADLRLTLLTVDCLSFVIDELLRCPPSFPKLKSLKLHLFTLNQHTKVMFLLLNHCPNLEVFTLESEEFPVEEWDKEQWELQCEGIVSWKSHPRLKTIKFVDFRGDDYELDFLIFLFQNAKTLERLDIIGVRGSLISPEMIKKVSMFPKASSEIVVTFHNPPYR